MTFEEFTKKLAADVQRFREEMARDYPELDNLSEEDWEAQFLCWWDKGEHA